MGTLINIGAMFAVLLLALAMSVAAVRLLDRLVFPRLPFEQALKENNLAVGIFLAGLVLGVFLLAGRAIGAPVDRYDTSFRKWGRMHFGYTYDWRWFKAQGMTESGLRPEVCSAVGACGLMQLMPGTALAMGLTNRFDARASIRAGIGYDRRLWAEWTAPRPRLDRLNLAFASYNAGLGHVLAAQRAAHGAASYAAIEPHLWREPRDYVRRIGRWRERFRGGRWH